MDQTPILDAVTASLRARLATAEIELKSAHHACDWGITADCLRAEIAELRSALQAAPAH